MFHRLCKASSLLILNHDLSSGIVGLRSRLVTCFYLNFTCFFEHFLQGTMDLRHRLITPPQRHLTNSLQTACGHLTIFTFPPFLPPYPQSKGEGNGVTDLLGTFDPPSSKCKSSGGRFLTGGGLTYIQPSPSGKNTKGSKLLFTFFERSPCLHPTKRCLH